MSEGHWPTPSDPCCLTTKGVCLDYVTEEDRTEEREGLPCPCPALVTAQEGPEVWPRRPVPRYGLLACAGLAIAGMIEAALRPESVPGVAFWMLMGMTVALLGAFVGMGESYWRVRRKLDQAEGRALP